MRDVLRAAEREQRGRDAGGKQERDERGDPPASRVCQNGAGSRSRRRGGEAGWLDPRVAGGIVERAAQVADQLHGGRIAGARILRERSLEDAIQLPGQGRVRRLRRRHGRVDVRERLGSRRLGGERAPSREELPGDDRECVAVTRRRRPLALRLLRRQVAGRSEDRPRLRERGQADRARNAEVRHVDATAPVQQEIGGLHVAMDDARRVRGIECPGRLLEPAERTRGRAGPACDLRVERAAGEVLHDDDRPAGVLGDVVDRDDVGRPGEPRRGKRLALEARAQRRVLRVAGGKDLQCDLAIELSVGGTEDLAHAPGPDRAGVAVTGREDVSDGRHAWSGNEEGCHARRYGNVR